jgi:hypothetical protein
MSNIQWGMDQNFAAGEERDARVRDRAAIEIARWLRNMPYWQARELGLQDHAGVLTRAAEAIEAGAWRGAK